MSEAKNEENWDVQIEDAPASKSGIPTWVWGCGGGCLFVLVAVIGGTWWFANKMINMFGPEAAWPVIAEIMPYGAEGSYQDVPESRPLGYVPALIPISQIASIFADEEDVDADLELKSIVFLSAEPGPSRPKGTGLAAMIMVFDRKLEGDPLEHVANEFEFDQAVVDNESHGRADFDFQGRVVPSWHMRVDPEEKNPILPGGSDAQSLFLFDATGDRDRTIVIVGISTGEMDAGPADLEEFLLPFRVWEGK